jgi:transposase/transcriptional regulator with XRE-family HTH domain
VERGRRKAWSARPSSRRHPVILLSASPVGRRSVLSLLDPLRAKAAAVAIIAPEGASIPRGVMAHRIVPVDIADEQVEEVVVGTLESTPKNATHWSRAKMADRSGLSKSTIGRIWKAFELEPHRQDGFKLSTDPQFVEKVSDVIGLYLNPPEVAVVYCVDEKSQVQALARSQPAFPMMPGMPEKRTHDYVRHGTTSLGVPPLEAPSGGVAAFNTIDGTVISSLHRRHRAIEFKKFLAKIDVEVPDGLEVHLVCDNYATHKSPTIVKWLDAHPRFHLHFTPTYSSWINQVERFFAYVTADLLQRSDHRCVHALEADIRNWVKGWNENPQPFIWTKTAEQILDNLKRLLQRTTGAGHEARLRVLLAPTLAAIRNCMTVGRAAW